MISALKFVGRHFLTVALVVIALIVGGYISGTVDSVRDFFFPETKAYVITNRTIVNAIRGMGQLVTVTSEIATTDVKVEIHQGFLNAGYYSASHIAIGAIEAGIDFEMIDEEDIHFQNDAYTLSLPAPTITSCRIEHIDQNQHSFTLLSADWDMVRQLAQHDAITKFAREMIEAGILQRAEKEAELQMGDFVNKLTGNAAQIEFKAREGELDLPISCQPITPSGWAKGDDGAWKRES